MIRGNVAAWAMAIVVGLAVAWTVILTTGCGDASGDPSPPQGSEAGCAPHCWHGPTDAGGQ